MSLSKDLSTVNRLFYLLLFSIAMGFMEAAVVTYLRRIYYPGGFSFPMQTIDAGIAMVEIVREAATLIMLIIIGIISGRNRTERLGNFLFCFAIWDIAYYVFLYLFLGWPASLITWDVLFLIPTTWTGPVLGPIINSISMILLALVIIRNHNKVKMSLSKWEWILLITGSVIIITSYMEDYLSYMLARFSFAEFINPSHHQAVLKHASQYIPSLFSWWKFILGEIFILMGIFLFYRRTKYQPISQDKRKSRSKAD